jgi:phosphoribosylformylglycinamidine synthase
MILFFRDQKDTVYAVGIDHEPVSGEIDRLVWLFSGARFLKKEKLEGTFIGPRKEMITPWSTNAVEITQNMGLKCIYRIE